MDRPKSGPRAEACSASSFRLSGMGQALKGTAQRKKIKQKEMTSFPDCSGRNCQKMEYGEVNVPGLTLMKLADFFDVSLDCLVGRGGERRVSGGGKPD